jgi:hypothetical protein
MINKKIISLGIIFLISISIFLISGVSAQETSYCCERTNKGAWCQDASEDDCDIKYRKAPTSCEATSYCKRGCCYDSQEGTCMENTPQKVCKNPNGDDDTSNGGIWEESAECDIPQCQLGCCLIGNQAAFVTQTRCKKLSSLYGLEIYFRTDISNEIQCIESAMPDVKGACVFEKEFERTCLFLTKKECQDMQGFETEFHENYLCSAGELATNCGPRGGTTCVEGKDEIFFLDTCGNLANVYDFNKLNDDNFYWTYVAGTNGVEVDCSSDSNAGSKTCGNCNYYLGSTCKDYKIEGTKPSYGNYICMDLDCEYKKEKYQHGETWCAEANGVSEIIIDSKKTIDFANENLPGSRYFRLICYNGEVTIEPCADYRQEVCIESSIGSEKFKTAACRANMWHDCVSQDNKKDCENKEKRDCRVIKGDGTKKLFKDENGKNISAFCVPKYAPGFDFWNTGGDAESLCSLASTQCVVNYEKGFFDGWRVKGRKTCLDNNKNIIPSWLNARNDLCMSLGDCGIKVNYIDKQGYHDIKDLYTIN